jgi:hypothetical protein
MRALPDTGAYETLISKDLVSKYGLHVDVSNVVGIHAANETSLLCSGSTRFEVFLQHRKDHRVSVLAYVTPDLEDELLLSWHHLIALGIIPKHFPEVSSPPLKKKSKVHQVTFAEEAHDVFGRRLRTFTPASSAVYSRVSDAEFKNAVEKKKKVINTQEGYFNVKCKNLPKLSVGADVLIQDPQSKLWNSKGKIAAIRENKRSYLVSVNGRNFVRNRKFIRPLLVTSDGDDDESKQESTEITPNLRRSQRKKNKPKRY